MFLATCLLQNHDQASQVAWGKPPPARAALVDHLSLTFPNPGFVGQCTAILNEAGFTVDYYPGEQVTVELYRNLPTNSYDLILFRVHSAYIDEHRTLAMFTSEPYSKKRYVYDQFRHRISQGHLEHYAKGDPGCLAITDKFISFAMEGSFNNTVVIMMGCAGIRGAARAFLMKGAKACIGWDGRVSARHTDRATIALLKHLFIGKQTIRRAVAQTMEEVGQEPQYKSLLLYWPIKAGDDTL